MIGNCQELICFIAAHSRGQDYKVPVNKVQHLVLHLEFRCRNCKKKAGDSPVTISCQILLNHALSGFTYRVVLERQANPLQFCLPATCLLGRLGFFEIKAGAVFIRNAKYGFAAFLHQAVAAVFGLVFWVKIIFTVFLLYAPIGRL